MRIIVKNADFSEVSIGKVVIDLSFSFDAADGVDAINTFFPNYNSGTPSNTTIYTGRSGETVSASDSPTNTRLVSDYIQVRPGMIINTRFAATVATTPLIIAFNNNKEIISGSCGWNADNTYSYEVPSGVAYIKVQVSSVATGPTNYTKVSGSTPN